MLKLMHYLRAYRRECLIGPIFKLLEAVFELLLPTLMVYIINEGVAKHNAPYVLRMGAWMLGLSVLGFCCSMLCQYCAARASQGFGTILRNTMFQHIQTLSHRELDCFGTASLTNRITNDINQLQLAVAMMIRLVVRAPFICFGAIAMAMMLDLRLSILLWGAIPIFAVILYLIMIRSAKLYRSYQQQLDRLAAVLHENLSGVRVIRAFARSRHERSRFSHANDMLTQTARNIGHCSALLNPLTSFVMNTVILLILWIGGQHVDAGMLGKGEIIAYANYITQILLVLIVISNLVVIFTKAAASAKRVNAVLAVNTSLTAKAVPALPHTAAEMDSYTMIAMHNVDFRYNPTGDKVLTNISVEIKAGETVGIIGGTGAGKSSFVNLLPRFYEAVAGEIYIAGKSVKEWDLTVLRKKFGVVPQKAVLFSGTIKDNLCLGNPKLNSDALKQAIKIAQADGFIAGLPQGIMTQVSRGGQNFSGGQKQRLTIARALAANPEILILDDAASALDFATEAALRRDLRTYCQQMTVLIVSQRVSSIRHADKILVFNDGTLAGCGTHTQLMETCAVYQEICVSQFAHEEVYA